MIPLTSIASFTGLTLAERVEAFDVGLLKSLDGWKDDDIYQLLKSVALDGSENTYIRKRALAAVTDYTLLKKFKIRKALTLLIDEWPKNQDIFLEAQRIKDLYLFYPEEKSDIENIISSYTGSEEAELSSEANYLLGLIKFQASIEDDDLERRILLIQQSEAYLASADREIENRIDAAFIQKVIVIVANAVTDHWDDLDKNLQSLSKMLFQLEANTSHLQPNPFFISLYRSVGALNILKERPVSSWLDFRMELTNVYNNYCDLQNRKIRNRLAESDVSAAFVNLITTTFVEPYYALNLAADLPRIEARLGEIDRTSHEGAFLEHLYALIKDRSVKKKADIEPLKNLLKRLFANRSSVVIQEALDKVKDETDPTEILNAYIALTVPTLDKFLDDLVLACLKLQGNRLYRGSCKEDDRNSFVASSLEASGSLSKDQTKWSISAAGKSAGELDIYVYDAKMRPFAIVEALNLDSLKSDYLVLHLDKLFGYDTAGHVANFILAYMVSGSLVSFWGKYTDFVKDHPYRYPCQGLEEITYYPYTNIKLCKTAHLREGKAVTLYHIVVDLQ